MNRRKCLVLTAIHDLTICKMNLFENIVEIAMSDELKSIADCVDESDKYAYNLNAFRDLKNPAVHSLIETCDFIEMQIASLVDIYNIDIAKLSFDR